MPGLSCSLDPTPAGPGRYGIRFEIHNGGAEPLSFTRWEPFLDFDLIATAPEGDTHIVRPSFDTGVQQVADDVPPGGTLLLETPIQLAFDPNVPPSGGPDPVVWTIAHAPARVEVTAVLHLPGGDLRCTGVLDPEAPGDIE